MEQDDCSSGHASEKLFPPIIHLTMLSLPGHSAILDKCIEDLWAEEAIKAEAVRADGGDPTAVFIKCVLFHCTGAFNCAACMPLPVIGKKYLQIEGCSAQGTAFGDEFHGVAWCLCPVAGMGLAHFCHAYLCPTSLRWLDWGHPHSVKRIVPCIYPAMKREFSHFCHLSSKFFFTVDYFLCVYLPP